MSSVDSRIVTMKFDNTAFERAVSATLSTLSKLSSALTGMPNSSKGLSDLSASASKVSMAPVVDQVSSISAAFIAMSTIAITALSNIVNRAVDAGLSLAKSLTVAPILDGYHEYETQLNSIQTILANTGLKGDKGLAKVNGALNELNHYSDKTIYNFTEMAKNIGTFTAAGSDLKTSTAAIKGIANLAAVSGSSSQQASTAMYQLSQALAEGKVSLMSWNSVVNAGMGGKVFQNSLMETARVHGVAIDQMVKDEGGFRNTLQNGWLTSDVLTETLAKFTGDLTKKQIISQGYTNQQAKDILAMGKTATDAATKVKTATQLIGTLKEAVASGWTHTWQLIFGDFNQAKETFTGVSNVLGGMIQASAKARNKVFGDWNERGGRSVLIEAISNAFHALLRVLRPIQRAFRDIFPAMTGQRLYDLTVMLRNFTEGLRISGHTSKSIRSIFHALFGVLGVGVEIFKGILRYVFSFIGILSGGTGGVLDFSKSITDLIGQLTDWILKGDYIAKFFDKIISGRAALLTPIIKAFSDVLSVLAGWLGTGAEVVIDKVSAAFKALAPYLPLIKQGLEQAGDAVQGSLIAGFNALQPVLDKIRGALADTFSYIMNLGGSIGGSVGGALGGLAGIFDIGGATDAAASGIDKVKGALESVTPSASAAKNEMSGFVGFMKSVGGFLLKVGAVIGAVLGMIWDDVSSTFSGLGSNTGEIMGNIKNFFGGILSSIAEFVSNISFGEVILALNTALVAGIGGSFIRFIWQFGGIFKDLRGVFTSVGGVFNQVTSNLKTMQRDVKSNIILKIAIALGILAISLYILSKIPSDKLATSLAAVSAMLLELVVAMKFLEKGVAGIDLKGAARMVGISVAIIALAAAILLMSIALTILSRLSWEEISKGLLTITAVMAGIVLVTKVLEKSGGAKDILLASIAIGILAFALTAFAGAVKLYSKLDTGMLANGGAKIAAMLIGIGVAMQFLPVRGALTSAAALLVISGALVLIAGALKIVASISGGDSFQAIITMAAALTILAIAANAMTGALAGAAAMLVMAIALRILVPAMVALGEMSWGEILKSLVALTAALVILGLVGAALIYTGAILGLVLLGAAILLLGVGMMAAGAGMLFFATGLTLLAALGSAAVVVLIAMINTFLEAIPGFIERLGASLITAAKVVQKAGPAFVKAGTAIIKSFLQSVIKTVPLIGRTFRVIIAEALKTLRAAVPNMIRTGFVILNAFLGGLLSNIGKIARTAAQIIVEFINGISKKMDKIVQAGANLIEKFVRALVSEMIKRANSLWEQARYLGLSIVQGLASAIRDGWNTVVQAAQDLAQGALNAAMDIVKPGSPSKVFTELGATIPAGLVKGMAYGSDDVSRSAKGMAQTALDTMKTTMSGISDALSSNVDFDPTITPVLDLTKLQNGASKIGGMLATRPITAGVSYAQAASISSERVAAAEAAVSAASPEAAPITFEQNNYSPKALSAVEIYRQTRNQLSLAKEALNAK